MLVNRVTSFGVGREGERAKVSRARIRVVGDSNHLGDSMPTDVMMLWRLTLRVYGSGIESRPLKYERQRTTPRHRQKYTI
jgi:hypothetical protein